MSDRDRSFEQPSGGVSDPPPTGTGMPLPGGRSFDQPTGGAADPPPTGTGMPVPGGGTKREKPAEVGANGRD